MGGGGGGGGGTRHLKKKITRKKTLVAITLELHKFWFTLLYELDT